MRFQSSVVWMKMRTQSSGNILARGAGGPEFEPRVIPHKVD